MWVVIFAIVVSAMAMFITPVKRAIIAKTLQTTNFTLWGIWGDETKEEGGWNHSQIGAAKTEVVQSLDNKNLERYGHVRTILNATSLSSSRSASY